MYKVELDKTKNLVKGNLSGFIKLDEVNAFLAELGNAIHQFKPGEVLLLGNLLGFKPTSPEVTQRVQKFQLENMLYFKKIATVHDNVLSQMQMKRIGDEVNIKISRFKTEKEAMDYLFS